MHTLRNLFLGMTLAIVAARAGQADCLCGADCLRGTVADEFAAERAGLQREWLVQLPFDASTSQLEHVSVGNGLVVAQTGDGNVHAIQATDGGPGSPGIGTLLWSFPAGGGGGPVSPVGIGTDIVAVAHDKQLFGIERGTGQLRWQERFGMLTENAPAVSGSWVYQPVGPSGLMRLPSNPFRPGPKAELPTKADAKDKKKARAAKKKQRKKDAEKASAESLEPISLDSAGAIQSQPQAFNGGVLWCTADGTLVAIEPSVDGWQRNEFYLDRAPAGRPVAKDGTIFAATAEGDLVRIDTVDLPGGGLRLTWRVLLESKPEADLFVSNDRVVVSLGEDGLACYSATTGEHVWSTWFPGRIVAVSGTRVWILDRVGRLTGIDAATGERRERFCLGDFTLPVVNQATDSLILASPSGAVVSLRPFGPPPAR
ncbi:MAG: PQQ-binding-like beta-propeller repeat protein [Planctomycetia bacterium]